MGWFNFGSGGGASAAGAGGMSSYGPYASGYKFDSQAAGAGGGGMMQQAAPMLSQMGGRGSGSSDASATVGNTIKSGSMAADKIGTAVTGPTVQKRAIILDLVPQMAHTGDSVGPVAKYGGGAAMARAADAERSAATDAFARDKYSALGRQIRTVNARGQVVRNGVGIVVELAKLIAGGAGAYGGAAKGGGGAGGWSGVGSYLGQEAAQRQGQQSGGGGMSI